MTKNQFLSLVRAALNIIGTVLMTYGVIDAEQVWPELSGAVLTLAGIGWGLYTHTYSSAVKAAAGAPGVEVRVGPTAPPQLRKLAADPSLMTIVPK